MGHPRGQLIATPLPLPRSLDIGCVWGICSWRPLQNFDSIKTSRMAGPEFDEHRSTGADAGAKADLCDSNPPDSHHVPGSV